jgi:hypothetical protein
MDDRDSLKRTVAGILAQTGRTDGWPLIEGLLREPVVRGHPNGRIKGGLAEVAHFDGLRDAGDQVINAVALADAALAHARAGGAAEIEVLEQQVELVKRRRADRLSR